MAKKKSEKTKSETPASLRKKRQTEIPGTERKSIPELDAAAGEYEGERDKRAAQSKKETEARDRLVAVMQKHGVSVYKFDGDDGVERVITLDETVKVKVKKADADDVDDD